MSLESEINHFMDETYGNLLLSNIRESKVIHMANLGTHQFFEYEMAIIDTPIVQRLKCISQLGPVYNVFPTARHTRFEHTLGVVISVDKMWKSISEKGSLSFLSNTENQKILANLRISAILHDIGHCPFSHVSEVVLRDNPSIKTECDKLNSNPHEVLGYYMLKSNVFKTFFEELKLEYGVPLDIDKISNYIIGKVDNPNEEQYIADFINGQFDADKLDYIIRDSEFSGVPLALGIDRLLLALDVDKTQTNTGEMRKKLIVQEKGIMSIEQLLLAKVMLYSSIYHHQKVRAIDNMIISILRMVIDEKIEINGNKISSYVDLLKLDDYDLLKLSTDHPKINELCNQLKTRQTFKRCFVISPRTKEEGYENQFANIITLSEYPSEIRHLNRELAERIGDGCTEFDVAFDLPKTPNLGETSQNIIKMGNEFISLKDVFPESGWLDSYMANKWKGHIFANDKYRKRACKEGKALLEDKFKIKFNDSAIDEAKIFPTYKPQKSISDY